MLRSSLLTLTPLGYLVVSKRKSLCIHSQLKSPSSSEVAAMIEGVVHHCTEMEVDRQYVDSHGQSTVAFAFCRLLGFQLLPRLKAIPTQKLSRPDVGQPDAYPRLQPILSKPIDWEVIRQQYDEMVKYVTAVRLGTAETEAILRRFTRSNVQHPTGRDPSFRVTHRPLGPVSLQAVSIGSTFRPSSSSEEGGLPPRSLYTKKCRVPSVVD